ncbi:unnamed protein product [Rhizophagus irregularis]|uniref:F-box domain-containing protein n=1 Tax=Rhizophagus irregularis TaxID=588596 RepID=A0A2I1GWG8_9GLOM|nr:hypothetical protein RhiirA4_467757 [Rhizophagus irregularis]CAB4439491.1 unnamed protein product [Rhizophagus irregularis]
MPNLNGDILYLIFKELELNEVFHSCSLVNKTWCRIIIPTLWKEPWKYIKRRKEKSFLSVIISHLSDKTRNDLIQKIDSDILKKSYKKPSLNYISYCRNLNLIEIERIINVLFEKQPDNSIIKNTIVELFINGNTKFTRLNIPHKFNIKLHLIPGAERCFSDLQFLKCNTSVDDKILTGLMRICKSIKEIQLSIEADNNKYGIIKLIENSEKLCNIDLTNNCNNHSKFDKPFCEALENSLTKHVNSLQCFTIHKYPITNISSFVNLKRLELNNRFHYMSWDCMKNLSLPLLQILKAEYVPTNVLENLIKNTNRSLIEININGGFINVNDNKIIIQVIYQNCPKLKYLKLLFRNDNIPELEKLLIKCKDLNGLYINFDIDDERISWIYLFNILTISSPNNLFKFKFFRFNEEPSSAFLELFFENWKGRHPILLHLPKINIIGYINSLKKYQSEGIIKEYDIISDETTFEDFEWTRKCFC